MKSLAAMFIFAVIVLPACVHPRRVGRTGEVLSVKDNQAYPAPTGDRSSKKRSGLCAVLSLGYGSLSTSELEWGHPEKETWGTVVPGIGIGWHGGEGQLFLEFILTGKHDRASTGWYDRNYEVYYFGFMPMLRHRLYGPAFGSFGYGFIGRYHSGGALGTTSDNYPTWSLGFDIEVMQREKLKMLIGFQKFNVTGHDDHEAPDWNLLTFHLTCIVSR